MDLSMWRIEMVCEICGQVAENVVAYELHKALGHEPWYVQLIATLVGTVLAGMLVNEVAKAAPKIAKELF
jgi:hypothetical protein